MRKYIIIMLLIALYIISISTNALATNYAKVQGYAQNGGTAVAISGLSSSTKWMQSYPNSTITVYDSGTLNLATIYTNNSGTLKSNPFTADSTAYFSFYGIAGNVYDIKFSGTGITTPFTLGGFIAGVGTTTGLLDPTTTVGDIIIRNAGNNISRLPVGSNGQFLTVTAGVPAWGTSPGFADPMTTRGDTIIRNSSNATTRLAIGSNGTYIRSNGTDPSYSTIQVSDLPSLSSAYVDLTTTQSSIAGAKTFTTSVTGPLYDKGGAFFNVKAYGAIGDGTTDDTTAIQNAINAVPSTGGTVYFPRGVYKITSGLTYGDGTSSTPSTKSYLSFIGEGDGPTAAELIPAGGNSRGATTISWFGASGGTILTLNGAMGGIEVKGIFFEAKGGSNAANTSINAKHIINSSFKNLTTQHHIGFAYIITAYTVAVGGVADGANDIVWERVSAFNPGTNGSGIQVGPASLSGGILDVARNTFDTCVFNHNGTGTGVELRYTDSSTFKNTNISKLTITKATDNAGFPAAITFLNSPVGTHTISSGWTPTNKIIMFPFPTGDSEVVPTDTGILGMTDSGTWFGSFTFRDALTLGGTSVGEIRLTEPSGTGTDYTGWIAPSNIASNVMYVLPTTAPTAGQLLSSTAPVAGIATTSWISSTSTPGGSNTNVQFNNLGTFSGVASFSWNNSNNTLLIGGPTSNGVEDKLHLSTNAASASPQLSIDDYGGVSNSFSLIMGRGARGTISAPTQTQAGDVLLGFIARGYKDSGGFSTANIAFIRLSAKEAITASAQGSFITLETTVSGTTTRNQSLLIDHDGSLTNLFSDAQTNATSIVGTYKHQTSGAAANGYGSRYLYQLEDDSGTMQNALALDVTWVAAATATRASQIDIKTTIPGGTLTSSLTLSAANRGTFARTVAASPAGFNAAFELKLAGFNGVANDGVSVIYSMPDSAGTSQFVGRITGLLQTATAGSVSGAVAINVRTNNADSSVLTEVARWSSAGVYNTFKGADVASAATITATGNLFHVTGNTGISAIATTNIQAGTCLNIIFDSNPILTDGVSFKLAGTTNYTVVAGTAMKFCYDGTAWQEFARAQR